MLDPQTAVCTPPALDAPSFRVADSDILALEHALANVERRLDELDKELKNGLYHIEQIAEEIGYIPANLGDPGEEHPGEGQPSTTT